MSALAMSDYLIGSNTSPEPSDKFSIWIDRVGVFLLCLKNEVTFGGPAAEGKVADISLLANLSRRHATFVRSGERYLLLAHAPVQVAGRAVHDRVDLSDGYEVVDIAR